jgi:hypothetical protein
LGFYVLSGVPRAISGKLPTQKYAFRGPGMKIRRMLTVLLGLMICGSVYAQRWTQYASTEDGFRLMAPGEFEIEDTEIVSEYGIVVPARIYSVDNSVGRYTVTVIDYTDAQRLHEERIAANEDVYLPIYGQVDVRGSMAFAAKKIRDRASSVEYDAYHYINRVDGHQLQTTNPDRSRTFAAIYLRESRLYVVNATVAEGTTPPGMFQQSLEFIDENGQLIRYSEFRDVYKISAAP